MQLFIMFTNQHSKKLCARLDPLITYTSSRTNELTNCNYRATEPCKKNFDEKLSFCIIFL